MKKVAIDDVEPEPYDESLHSDRRALSDPLGTAHVAVTRYVLEPGERFSGSLHAHADQEEVFVVVEGEATFRTRADGDPASEEREVTVGAGEAVRFAPGEFQSGGNDVSEPRSDGSEDERSESSGVLASEASQGSSDDRRESDGGNETVVALALGAPRETDDIRIARIPGFGEVACPECGREAMQIPRGDESGLVCPECGATLAVE